ncbi:hypothetical protein Tco_0303509 [Tanacetum coccineum]
MGSSCSRIIFFGTIPAEIPAETPVILPVAPEVEATRVASPVGVLDLITYSSSDSDSSEDPHALEHAPTRWRSRVALRSSSPSSPTHDLSPVVVASPTPFRIVPALPRVPRRPTILVLPDHSSPDSPSETSSHHSSSYVAPSSSLSVGPSRKRCRSLPTLVTAVAPTPGSLAPDIDSDVMADIEADIAAETAVTEAATTVEVFTGFEADIEIDRDDDAKEEAESSARGTMEIGIDRATELEITADIPAPVVDGGDRETFDIGLDVVIQELYDHMVDILVQRIADVKEEQRCQEVRALSNDREMTRTMTITRSKMTPNGVEELISRRVAEALEAYEANRGNGNGNGIRGGNGDGNPNMNAGGFVPIAPEPIRLQDAIRVANNLMDQKLKGYTLRNAENKRRFDSNQRDNRVQQSPAKRLHHVGQCNVKYGNCKKVRHMAKGCKAVITATAQRALMANRQAVTCYECGENGYYKCNISYFQVIL